VGARGVQRGDTVGIRLGLVGAGRWGRRIIDTVSALPDCELAAICTRGPAPHDGGDVPWFARWQDLVATGGCDGVIIATPPEAHVPIALEALGAGLAVMIEKPLALGLADAKRLADFVASRPSCPAVLVDHTHLFAPAYQALKSGLRSPIVEIRTRGCSFEPWRPYSSLYDFGPHDLAMVLDLFGSPPDLVACRLLSEVTRDARVHQLFGIELAFGPARVSCVVGNAAPEKARRLEVLCENGDRFVYDDLQPSSDKLRIDDRAVALPADRPLALAIAAFARSIRGPRDPRCGLDLSMKVQAVLEECGRQRLGG
jgi:predicted dehydrogenase